ncbi:MAG TPA: hypothetical protein VHO69_11970 [Phototrophicaceae bacterium]|nr:hypothetical protein [Phototrophicaceae bacterium]
MNRISVLIVFSLLLAGLPVQAQDNLTLFTPATGHIASGDTQSWTFRAVEGSVLSLLVQATSGDLDPQFSIISSSGTNLIGGDDYNYPASGDALLEAITMPRTDTYTVRISGFGTTSGDYTLTLLAGYGQVNASDDFSGAATWKTAGDAVEIAVADEALALALNRPQQTGIAVYPNTNLPAIYYLQTTVTIGVNQDNWMVGLTARQGGGDYYLLLLNERGEWRFLVRDDSTEKILRDWVSHPAIVAGNKTFTLGMLVNGSNFDFFYNGSLIGRQTDATIPEGGTFGLAIQTGGTLNPQMAAQFDNLFITTPLLINKHPVLPTQLLLSTPASMAQELQRRNVIPSGGEMALNVAESFAELAKPGVERFLLGRGTTYQHLVMGTTFSWQADTAGMTGCGFIFRAVDENHYLLAYADRTGGYGLAQRVDDTFQPGIFGEKPIGSKESFHLLVVALEDQIHYYVDGLYVGTLQLPATEGAVGNAVVNFEPINTSCQFRDTWVWRWD